MHKAPQQHKAEGHQTASTRSRSAGPSLQFVPAASAGLARLESSSPLMQRQGQIAQRINSSERLLGQRHSFESYHAGPHAATQRRAALEYNRAAADRGKPAQRVQEEEALQGKFAVQRVEEEEPLQGKFVAQRVEKEEPLQGKFAAQRVAEEEPLQGKFAKQEAIQRKEGGGASSSGLPENLRSGIESLSGIAMDHVKVHYNSTKPAQLNAHAFAQGSAIHLAPGQERHLPHEAWHVVQQAQGRVQPTTQMKTGVPINENAGLEREADVMGAKASASGAVPAQRVGSGSYVPLPGIEEEKTPNVEKPAYEQMEEEGQEVEARRNETGILGSLKKGASWLGGKLSGAKDSITGGAKAAGEYVGEKAGAAKEWASEHQEGIKSAFGGVKDESSQTMNLAKGIDDVQQASPKVGLDVYQKSDSVWNKIFGATLGNGLQKVLGVLTELVSPLVNAGLAFLDAKTKWGQWDAYKNAVMDEKGQKKPDAHPEAVYALDKIPKGFYRKVAEFFVSVGEFTMNLLTIIPSGIGQIVGLAGKIALSAGRMIGTLAGKAKGFFQAIFGEKKVANSQNLLGNALAGDEKSLKLILSLKLPSIAGTDYKLLDAMLGMKHILTESAASTIKGGLGFNDQKADRIIDKYGAGTGGPSDTKTLREYLALICKNAASKELILGELKETMTGVGT